MLADRRGHGKAQVGVDVDLAHRALRCLAEHLLRNANGIRHLAAVGVDLLDELRNNGGRAVQNDREARKSLRHFFEDVEAQLRLLAGFELISACLLYTSRCV